MNIPFPVGRLALRKEERIWLSNVLKKYKADNILEFGCGASTWIINESLKPSKYTAIEDYQPNIDMIKDHCPNVKIIDNWDFSENEQYDFVFVDSSAGCGIRGMHRDKAIIASEPYMTDDCILAIHDWNTNLGKKPRAYLEQRGWELLDSTPLRKGLGVYRRPKAKEIDEQNEAPQQTHKAPQQVDEAPHRDTPVSEGDCADITVVTAVDKNHIERLESTLPTWIKLKKLTCPIFVFAHEVDPSKTSISEFKNVKIIPWNIQGVETQRERMLSAFLFGVAEHVKTDFWLKLDSDTIALNDDDKWLNPSFFNYDMVGQKWGYTKPGSMVPRIDHWLDGLYHIGGIKNFYGVDGSYVLVGDDKKPEKLKYQASRVISWIRFTRTSMIRDIAECCHYGRMPVPSEDTLVWRWCDKIGLKWDRHDFKQYGWDHDKKGCVEKSQQALAALS